MTDRCGLCKKTAQAKCGKCNTALYCSRNCQQQDWAKHKLQCIANETLVLPATQGPKPFASVPVQVNVREVFERQTKRLTKKIDEATAKLQKPHSLEEKEELYTELYDASYEATKAVLIAHGATETQLRTLQKNLSEMRTIVYNLQMGMLKDQPVPAQSFERYTELDTASRTLMNQICGIRAASQKAQEEYEAQVFDEVTFEFLEEAADAYVNSLDAMRAAAEKTPASVDGPLSTVVDWMNAGYEGLKQATIAGIEGNKQYWYRTFLRCQGEDNEKKFLSSTWSQRESLSQLKKDYESHKESLRLLAKNEGIFSGKKWAIYCLEQLEQSEKKVETILENEALSEKDRGAFVERQSWLLRMIAHVVVVGGIYGMNVLTGTKTYNKTRADYEKEHANLTDYIDIDIKARDIAQKHMQNMEAALRDTNNYLQGNQTELVYTMAHDRLILRNPNAEWLPILNQWNATGELPPTMEPFRYLMPEMRTINSINETMRADLNNPNKDLAEGTSSWAFANPLGPNVTAVTPQPSSDVSKIPPELLSATTKFLQICSNKALELKTKAIDEEIAKGSVIAKNVKDRWIYADQVDSAEMAKVLMDQMIIAYTEGRLSNDPGIQKVFNEMAQAISLRKGGNLARAVVEEYSKRLDPKIKDYTEQIAALNLLATNQTAQYMTAKSEWQAKDAILSEHQNLLNVLTSEEIEGANIPQSFYSRLTQAPSDVLYVFQDLIRTVRTSVTGKEEPPIKRFTGWFLPVAEAESKLFSKSVAQLQEQLKDSTKYNWPSIYNSIAQIAMASVSFAMIGGWFVAAGVALGVVTASALTAAIRLFFNAQNKEDEARIDKIRPYQGVTMVDAMKSSGMRQIVKKPRGFSAYVTEAVGTVTKILNMAMLFGQTFYGLICVLGYVEPADVITTFSGVPFVGYALATTTRPFAWIVNSFFQISLLAVTMRSTLPEHITGGPTCWDVLITSLATLGPMFGGILVPSLRTPLSSEILAGLAGFVTIFKYALTVPFSLFEEVKNVFKYTLKLKMWLVSGALDYAGRFFSPSLKDAPITAPESRGVVVVGKRGTKVVVDLPPPPRLGPRTRVKPRSDEPVTPVPSEPEKRGRARQIEPPDQPEEKRSRSTSRKKVVVRKTRKPRKKE